MRLFLPNLARTDEGVEDGSRDFTKGASNLGRSEGRHFLALALSKNEQLPPSKSTQVPGINILFFNSTRQKWLHRPGLAH